MAPYGSAADACIESAREGGAVRLTLQEGHELRLGQLALPPQHAPRAAMSRNQAGVVLSQCLTVQLACARVNTRPLATLRVSSVKRIIWWNDTAKL